MDICIFCGKSIVRKDVVFIFKGGGVFVSVPCKRGSRCAVPAVREEARQLHMVLHVLLDMVIVRHDFIPQRVCAADLTCYAAFAARADFLEIPVAFPDNRFPNKELGGNCV